MAKSNLKVVKDVVWIKDRKVENKGKKSARFK
jgi:hypothetical protein